MDFLLQPYVIYTCVFLAIVLPVLFWKKTDGSVAGSFGPDGEQMPKLFRLMWSVVLLFEYPLGKPVAGVLSGKSEKYGRLIRASGFPLTPERIFVMQVFCCIGAAVFGVGAAIALKGLFPQLDMIWCGIVVLFFMFVGWTYPAMALESYVQWRQSELMRSLPFAIDLIGSAMRSGLEFGAAMRYFTGLKMKGPLTEEFGTVIQQIELGRTRTQALADMAYRVQIEEFTSFVGVVAYGTEIGASIADTLRVHGEELRKARFHLAERKAARAPSLMILPIAMFIMPAVFIIIITPLVIKMKGTGIGGQ